MKKYLKLVGKLLSILSLIFIVYAVWKLGLDFSNVDNVPIFILVVIIGTIGKMATVFVSGTIWNGWVSFFAGKKSNLREALYVYTKANIGKYLPGNVMQYVERNLFADKMGVGQKKIAASSLIEVISLILVAFITALLFSQQQLKIALVAVKESIGDYYIILMVSVILVGTLVAIAACIFLRKKLMNILKEYSLAAFIKQLIISMLGQAVVLITLGIIFVMLYAYMGGDITLSTASGIVAGYIISWVLGFVVPGAPGGIGVRELVLTLLVGSIVGQELVLTIALIHRLITIIGDFLDYVIGMVFLKSSKEENE